MADEVFGGEGDLSEGLMVTIGLEDGVVAEASVALFLVQYGAMTAAFEVMDFSLPNEADNGYIVGTSIGAAL